MGDLPVETSPGPAPPRYKLTIAYDGSGFHGWQRQVLPDAPEPRTVQQVVEAALVRVFRAPVHATGASRTDTGVHALGQVAHVDGHTRVPVERLALAINSRLPDDVEVRSAELAPPGFHAIRSARRKRYEYRIYTARPRPLTRRRLVHHYWMHPLGVRQMNEAAGRLVGTHDFEGFSAAGHGRQSTVRTVYACEARRDGDDVVIAVEGDGFLYNMVRIIAGTLLEAGRGAMSIEQVERAVATADRRLAGPTLPPQGLCLMWIRHEPDAGSAS